MTPKMVELARVNAAKVGATNVEFRQSEVEALPLPDEAVDVAMANCVVNLTPDKSAVLAEAYRVLKPNGRLALAEVLVDGDTRNFPLTDAEVLAGLSAAGFILGALSIEEFTKLLDDAGFTDIEIAIQHRYSPEELLDKLPTALQSRIQSLDPAVVEEMTRSVASCTISAKKKG
jgi:ubiquinone/menaquinone biosynthesis C-methylase UbiE